MDFSQLITAADLLAWWEAHPTKSARRANACHCIVTQPVVDTLKHAATYCPGESHVHLWPLGTRPNDMYTGSPFLVRKIPVENPLVSDVARAFDLRGDFDALVSGKRCAKEIKATIANSIK
jgi:hypothetical protein